MVAPDVQLPADLITTTRGTAAAEARAFLESFGCAIGPYREGRCEEAAKRLASLTPQHGHVAEVWFYLGVSQLFAGRPTDALDAFDRPGVAAAVGDDVQWQRAVRSNASAVALNRMSSSPRCAGAMDHCARTRVPC